MNPIIEIPNDLEIVRPVHQQRLRQIIFERRTPPPRRNRDLRTALTPNRQGSRISRAQIANRRLFPALSALKQWRTIRMQNKETQNRR
jgi:hypothetical protein